MAFPCRPCLQCDKSFVPKTIHNGRGKFCSKNCYWQRKGNDYRKTGTGPMSGKRHTKEACEKMSRFQRERVAQPHYVSPTQKYALGDKKICERWGYALMYVPEYYKRHQFVAEHKLIAEQALGRKLRRGEIVHHVNGDKADNRNQNLLICSRKYHAELHQEMARRYQREHFAGGAL